MRLNDVMYTSKNLKIWSWHIFIAHLCWKELFGLVEMERFQWPATNAINRPFDSSHWFWLTLGLTFGQQSFNSLEQDISMCMAIQCSHCIIWLCVLRPVIS